MSRRCVFGCGSPETLFPIPKIPWLRSRWLDFLHFGEGAISDRSRLCSKHFTRECFKNWTEHEMGFVRYLSLTDTAVPSVYTVGSPQSSTVVSETTQQPPPRSSDVEHRLTGLPTELHVLPLTRDVACQCDAPSLKKSASIQTVTQKLKRRSKAIQVKPLSHSIGITCSADNVGTSVEPPRLTSTPIKRPRMEDSAFSDSST
ncbi:unnamed protein product [Leuciscus chuanchicus]